MWPLGRVRKALLPSSHLGEKHGPNASLVEPMSSNIRVLRAAEKCHQQSPHFDTADDVTVSTRLLHCSGRTHPTVI